MLFAIVDIETTGGSAQWHKITEIAIFLHDGKQVIDSYQSLINPQRPIPANITSLTGITNEMVADAPTFEQVAYQIEEFTKKAVFVAHNVNFDFSFVKKEFANIGIAYSRKRLCTVRLSRKMIPGLKSYSLGRLCADVGISISSRHRAGGDAEATAQLFSLIAAKENFGVTLHSFLKQNSKEYTLPPHINRDLFDKLPDTVGVYIFYDEKGKVVYVGKAQKIKTRVYEHFSSSTHTKTKTWFHNSIHDVTCEETGSEFIALLVENELIKKYYPMYNKVNKKFDLNAGLYKYQDQNGYWRLSISKAGKRDTPMLTFASEAEALNFVLNKVKEYNLCMRLAGLILPKSACPADMGASQICHQVCHHSIGSDAYNERFEAAFASSQVAKSYLLKSKGRHEYENAFVMVEKGKFLGYGFIDNNESITSVTDVKNFLTPCYDTRDSQTIIDRFKHAHGVQIIQYGAVL